MKRTEYVVEWKDHGVEELIFLEEGKEFGNDDKFNDEQFTDYKSEIIDEFNKKVYLVDTMK